MFKGLIGKKIGMTQIFDENGAAVPVTLIEAGPCFVTQVRTTPKEGYSAVQLGFAEVKPKKIDRRRVGASQTQQSLSPKIFTRIPREGSPSPGW